MASAGLLGVNKPVEYGGMGLDFKYSIALNEALGNIKCGAIPMSIAVQTDMATPALARFGRVKIYSGTFIAGGVACLCVALILWTTPRNSTVWLVIIIAMTGKFLISGTFALAYLYTAELFPTPVRNVAVGGASTFARIGSMSAPYIVDILGSMSAGIPALIFGVFSVLAGGLSMMLPETLNKTLPETVADVENWNKSHQTSDPETKKNEA